MRLAKLCITLALALCGWHAALAAALCARHADCHAPAAPRASHAGHETPSNAADERHQATTTHAAADPADDLEHRRGHCGGETAESPREVARAASHGAGQEAARGEGENFSTATVTELRSPGSSCAHCVGRQTHQPARVKAGAPAFARDAHDAPAPVRHLVALQRPAPRTRFAPTEHSPPRGRPLHVLNSALLI